MNSTIHRLILLRTLRFSARSALVLLWSFLLATFGGIPISYVLAEAPYSIAWTRQLGTANYDESRGAYADGLGNVFITGMTDGSFGGPNAGDVDAFISKYDSTGNLVWTKQLGTARDDVSDGVSADRFGNVFITGYTQGSLGGPNAGIFDGFVSKYDTAGNLAWTKQFGTSTYDFSTAASTDGLGNVYVSGDSYGPLGGPGTDNAFVSKYDTAGNLVWIKSLGTANHDKSRGVSVDVLGNVFISGATDGSLGGPHAGSYDAFVSKYDTNGNLAWTKQLGSANFDYSTGVSADGMGNVFITGYTQGSLGGPNAGNYDAFVSKYDAAGNLIWTEQLGTSSEDRSLAVSADGLGNVFITGYTDGALGVPYIDGGVFPRDAFVSKYDATGNLAWTMQLGTTGNDESNAVIVDGLGNVYLSGFTTGSFPGYSNTSRADAFLIKLAPTPVPEPSTLVVAGLSLMGFAWLRLRHRTPRVVRVEAYSRSPQ